MLVLYSKATVSYGPNLATALLEYGKFSPFHKSPGSALQAFCPSANNLPSIKCEWFNSS